MRPYLLWRLTGATSETIARPERLSEGLALHLRYTDLLTVLIQIGDRQQAYLVLRGCATCVQTRCAPGCPVQLLRRLLLIAQGVHPRVIMEAHLLASV